MNSILIDDGNYCKPNLQSNYALIQGASLRRSLTSSQLGCKAMHHPSYLKYQCITPSYIYVCWISWGMGMLDLLLFLQKANQEVQWILRWLPAHLYQPLCQLGDHIVNQILPYRLRFLIQYLLFVCLQLLNIEELFFLIHLLFLFLHGGFVLLSGWLGGW